jgi:hypothetical protein
MIKVARALGTRGGASAQVIPPPGKGWEEAKASVNMGDMALITLVGGGGDHPNGEPHPYQGGGGQRDWRAGWTNIRNHKLKVMMDPYLDRYNGQIHLAEVLNMASKQQQDLPTLPHFCYANGCPFLCWNSTLGWCMYHECCYLWEGGHPNPNDILDDFANKVIGVLSTGIQAHMQTGGGGGSPGKKVKNKPINLAWQQIQPSDTTVGKGDRDKLRDKLQKQNHV